MTQAPGLPTREPVCDIPREAARPGPEPQPEMLPDKARFLSGAISFSIIPRLRVKEPCRRLMALETAVTRWAKHAVKPLAPTTVHRVEHAIARCLVLHDLACRRVHCARKLVASVCRGGFPASSLMDLANRRETSVPVAFSAAAPTTPPWSASTTWPPGVWAVSSIAAPSSCYRTVTLRRDRIRYTLPEGSRPPQRRPAARRSEPGQASLPGTRLLDSHSLGKAIPAPNASRARRLARRLRARVGVCGVCADLS